MTAIADPPPARRGRPGYDRDQVLDVAVRLFNEQGYDTMGSETPVVPVLVGSDEDTFGFWKMLDDRGIFANPVVAPGSPPGKGLIRTSYMATHQDDEIARVIEVFGELSQLRIAPRPLHAAARG